MKVFRSESLVDYKTYTFNYATYCVQEANGEIPEIYDLGFLPYSNDTTIQSETYYLARSLRVNLSDFKRSSENRRVAKKIAELNISFKVIDARDFDFQNKEFRQFCLNFAQQRFSESLSPERLDYILNRKSISKVFVFDIDDEKVGYVIAIDHGNTLHYWFAFFSLNYPSYGLGKWMMCSVIEWCQHNNFSYTYLGTCYGEKSLYKVRDFKGLSFYDGNSWNSDIKHLKEKCKTDSQFLKDDFKKDPKQFIE